MTSLALIAAVAQNGVIGIDNRLPWHLSRDLKYFKQTTLNHAILMGRKTFESLGRALPLRRNIVMTKNQAWRSDGCEVVHSIEQALNLLQKDEKMFVIGGEEIFNLAFSQATDLYLTEIHQDFAGNVFFPSYEKSNWQEVSRYPHLENEINFDFVVYKRQK